MILDEDWWTRWKRRQAELNRFDRARIAERAYGVQLRRLAAAIDGIVRGFVPSGTETVAPDATAQIIEALTRYAALINPWAQTVASRMLSDVSTRNMNAWSGYAREIGVALRREIETAPTGETMRRMMAEQVDLITSLPREAAERVHQMTIEGITMGRRAKDVAAEILRTGEVTRSRANLIARTEIGRTAGELNRARAESIGSEGYIWTSAGDRDVRPAHRKLDGKFIRWNEPPIASEPGQKVMRYHAGCGPNCRCAQRVVIPQRFLSSAMRRAA